LTMGHGVDQGLPCITKLALFEHPSLPVAASLPTSFFTNRRGN
jgi:hypothetical protein